jgi:signal transduction histidine kinase
VDVRTERDLLELNTELEQRIADRTAELESARAELERRSAYLETVVQQIPAGLVIADAETGAFTLANDQAKTILGPLVPIAQSVSDLGRYEGYGVDGSAYAAADWPLARALRGEYVAGERVTVVRPHATSVTLDISAAPVLDSTGRLVGAAALFHDVTEAEARRRAATDFIANAAHELRTPLAAIVSSIDVLEAGAKHQPAERDRFLTHMGREAGRLVRLTRTLLLLARVQSGTEAARVEIVELAPLLSEVAASLRPEPGVKLSVRCGQRAAALANRGLLEQALTTVAGNAARYTERGRILLSATRKRDLACIRVRDTGRGMAAAELARAGERFFRGEETATGGFGLGLSIAREAITAMGGDLSIESEPGVGTTVVMQLPGAQLLDA